jgi:hypothetical protein
VISQTHFRGGIYPLLAKRQWPQSWLKDRGLFVKARRTERRWVSRQYVSTLFFIRIARFGSHPERQQGPKCWTCNKLEQVPFKSHHTAPNAALVGIRAIVDKDEQSDTAVRE